MRGPLDPIAYVYMASVYCPSCARDDYGDDLDSPDTVDGEGNAIGAVAPWDSHQVDGLSCSCGHAFN